MRFRIFAFWLSLISALNVQPGHAGPSPIAQPPVQGSDEASGKAIETNKLPAKSNFRLHISRRTKFEQPEPDKLLLDSGEMVIEALHGGVIGTPLAHIYVKTGVVLLCQVQEGIEYIYVLSDSSPQSTSVIVNKRRAQLSQGVEAIVSDHQANYKELGGPDDIGHRAMRMHLLGDNRFMLVSEFSLMDALQHNRLLLGIKQSDEAADVALSEKLLKTVAVITSVTGRRGAYTNSGRE